MTTQPIPTYGSTFYDPKTGQAAGVNKFDPNTGKPLVAPTPATGTTNTGGIKTTNPPVSNNPYLEQVQALMKLSPAEVEAQKQLNTLQSNATQGQFNVSQQPIAQGFISGQQAAMQTQANIAQQPLQQKLALAQSQRQAALDSAKTALQYQSPVSLGIGTNLVNSLTGDTVAQGQSYQAKQGASNVLSLSKTYPDAGILPSDDPDTAAQKASNAPSFIAKFGKVQAMFNPITGELEVIPTSRLGTTTPGSSYTGNPNGTGTIPVTGGGSSGGGGNTSTSSNTFSNGASKAQIMAVQQALGIKADGIAGPQTRTAVMKFQSANGVPPTGIIDSATLKAGQFGVDTNIGGGNSSSQSPKITSNIPTPTTYQQKSFFTDMTSGSLAKSINAQNTAIGHLSAALDLGQMMKNEDLKGKNYLKNWLNSQTGKDAISNYNLAHGLSSSELSTAYGNDTGSERQLTEAIGNSNSSPAQILGFAKTSAELLASKILSNIQQYKAAYGSNAKIPIDSFVSPESRAALSKMGIDIMSKAGLGSSDSTQSGGEDKYNSFLNTIQ